MLPFEQLYEQIPKKVCEWTEAEVSKWFQMSQIQLKGEIRINGQQFLDLTPESMLHDLGLSHFIIRKLSEWLEFDAKEYDEYVDELQEMSIEKKAPMKNNFVSAQSATTKLDDRNENQKDWGRFEEERAAEDQVRQRLEFDYKSAPLIDCEGKISNTEIESVSSQLVAESECEKEYNPHKYRYQKSGKKPEKQNQSKAKGSSKIDVSNSSQNSLFTKKPAIMVKVDRHGEKSQKNKGNRFQLNGLLQNSESEFSEVEEIQTCQNIPENSDRQGSEYYCDADSSPQSNKKVVHPSIHSSPAKQKVEQEMKDQSDYYSKNVKFVSSHLTLPHSKVVNSLIVHFASEMMVIENPVTKIGRSTSNDILLRSDGVSRTHAQIHMQKNEQSQESSDVVYMSYYIKDVGSRFGTFVEVDPQRPRRVLQGQTYCVGSTTLYISKFKISKSKDKFDLSLVLTLQEEETRNFYSRSLINIGRKKRDKDQQTKRSKDSKTSKLSESKDIELEDVEIRSQHCRFVLLNGELHLEQVEGNIMEKVNPHEMYRLSRTSYTIKFGEECVDFRIENLQNHKFI